MYEAATAISGTRDRVASSRTRAGRLGVNRHSCIASPLSARVLLLSHCAGVSGNRIDNAYAAASYPATQDAWIQ